MSRRDTTGTRERKPRLSFLGAMPLTLLFIGLLVVPLILTIILSFKPFDYDLGVQPGWSFEQYIEIFTSSYTLTVFWRTLWISGLVTLICVLIGVPESYILSRMKAPWNSVFLLVILSPLLISLVVRAFGWSMLLNPMSPIGKLTQMMGLGSLLYTSSAVVIGLVHVMLPFMIIPVWTSLNKIDPQTIKAAYSLNATKWQTIKRVILPQATPGILSGSLIVFGLSTSAFAIPVLLGGGRSRMVSNSIYEQFMVDLNWPMGAALAILLLIMNLIIMMSYNQILERSYRRSLG